MSITNGYCTLLEFKSHLFASGISDNSHDPDIESKIEALSRFVDGETKRFFYKTSSQSRYFTAEWGSLLLIPDLVTITSLKTDEDGDRVYERTWASTDYDLEPYNASLDGIPYTRIRVTPKGRYSFSTARRGIEITGEWGWPAVPKMAKEACLLLAIRLYKRKDAPFGVIGSAELGQLQVIARTDPDAQQLLGRLARHDLGGV